MNKKKITNILSTILFILLINFGIINQANAAGGAIVKIFTSIGKLFKAGKGAGSKVDDISKILGKESKINKNLDNLGNISSDEARIIEKVGKETQGEHFNNLHSFSIRKLFRKHGIENVDNIADLTDIIDIKSTDEINKYIIYHWTGRVYRASDYFSKPKQDDRILLVCNTQDSIFYFSIIMEEKIKKAFLTDNIANVTNYNVLKPQELIVTKDLDELKIMATKPLNKNNFPSHYFIIYKNQSFNHETHLYGTENPNIVFVRAEKGSRQIKYKCYKISKNGLFVKK